MTWTDLYERGAMGAGGCDPARCRVDVRSISDGPPRWIVGLTHVTDGVEHEVVCALWDTVTESMIERKTNALMSAIAATFPVQHAAARPPVVRTHYTWVDSERSDAAE